MTIRHAEFIDSTIYGGRLGSVRIPVLYTDELKETSLSDIAFCSSYGDFLPYLSVGFFSNGEDNRVFFANARRHEEMGQVIENDTGEHPYLYGQIMIDRRIDYSLVLPRIDLAGGSTVETKRVASLRLLIDSISDDYLPDRFDFCHRIQGWGLRYFKDSNTIHPIPRIRR